MHDRSSLAELRVDRFLRERLVARAHRAAHPLELEFWDAPGEPVTFDQAAAGDYTAIAVGDLWGRPWGTTWFRIRGAVPAPWRNASGELPASTRAELVVDLGFTSGQPGFQCEGMVWDLVGHPVRGIAPLNNVVSEAVAADGTVDVFLEAASNPDVGSLFTFDATPVGDVATAGGDPIYRLRHVELRLRDLEVSALLADTRALRGLVDELDPASPRRAEIMLGLERMIDAVDPEDVAGTAAAGRAILAPLLARPAAESAHVLHAVGHAHIDSAWLWPVRETVRKVARTFSNVLSLMDEDPDFVFAASSAQQYAWIKDTYPDLFDRIKARIAEGRFVPVGSMWVESDTNLPGSEAMARQFVAGKGFFLREFGIDTPEVWLPDSFGYTGALPQIAAAAGARWFLTQKISWNETNRMPHHTFRWEGIDGTRLFTHFPPVDTYNSVVSASELAHAEHNFADKGRATVSLLPYGYGDGGGGPTREMTQAIARTTSLEGSPKVLHSTPRAFFEAAEGEYPLAEVWVGELYLEFHRGTYTSQLATKQGNRRSEHLLREAELWATTAAVRADADYPAARIARAWETVLLQQFHDILPGSSIAWVYHDAERNYAAIARELEDIIASSLRALAGTGERTLRVNAAPHARDGVPALGAVGAAGIETVTPVATGDGWLLDNGMVRATIDARGLVTSAVEVESGREAVAPGAAAGLLQLHRDTPTQWDAWDVDVHYRDVVRRLARRGAHLAGSGFARAVVRVRHRLARAPEAAQARVPGGRAHRLRDVGDPVRPHRATDAHQHLVGRGALRDRRTPLGAGRRAGFRRRGGQRFHLRARHYPRRPRGGTRHGERRPAIAHPRGAVPGPHARPGRALAARRSRDRRRRRNRGRGGIPHQPSRARRRGRRRRDRAAPLRRHRWDHCRSGEARRGRQR
jgi:alpha-mannosidase